jgi:DNA-binding transcriptional MerR regulator
MISEVAKQVEVEDHVLRYWQKQLELPISRNEMKQRYYKETDIKLLKKVKQLKERGFQLKAIKMLLESSDKLDVLDADAKQLLDEKQIGKEQNMPEEEKQEGVVNGTSLITDEDSHEIAKEEDSKMNQFKTVLNHIILNALRENNGILAQEIGVSASENIIREMNYLMRLQEEKEEERFRKFDATLRDYQKSRMMSAATIEHKRKKSKFFKKNNVYI